MTATENVMQKKTTSDLIEQTTDLFTAFDQDYGTLRLQLIQGKIFLHYDSKKFTHSIYKILLDNIQEVSEMLKKHGFTELFTCVKDEPKVCKFQELFGFKCIGSTSGIKLFQRGI